MKTVLRNLFNKARRNIVLFKTDYDYYLFCGFNSCFSIFPPSFYITHTQEEIEEIKKELRKFLNEE